MYRVRASHVVESVIVGGVVLQSQHPDSPSSQFYTCDGAQYALDGQYAVFGRVVDGMDVVRRLRR